MARKKRKFIPNNDKSTWENTAKEQPYLMPGTVEYQEYQEDLQAHDPFRPDDEWHDKQEEKNEEHPRVMAQKQVNPSTPGASKRKYMNYIAKQVQFDALKAKAKREAAKTEDKSDDKRAAGLTFDKTEDLVYNEGVTPDEYLPKALTKYM